MDIEELKREWEKTFARRVEGRREAASLLTQMAEHASRHGEHDRAAVYNSAIQGSINALAAEALALRLDGAELLTVIADELKVDPDVLEGAALNGTVLDVVLRPEGMTEWDPALTTTDSDGRILYGPAEGRRRERFIRRRP